jgi:hypothetical protein
MFLVILTAEKKLPGENIGTMYRKEFPKGRGLIWLGED